MIKVLGEGSNGKVVKAKCRLSGRHVAIKMVENIFCDTYAARCILREVQVMHQLSKMEENIFTVKLRDILLPV